jgi:hypothetical protein
MNATNTTYNADLLEDSDIDSKSVSRRAGASVFSQAQIDNEELNHGNDSLSSSPDEAN